jgi:hypothetical protein
VDGSGNEEPERINWNLLGAKTMTQHCKKTLPQGNAFELVSVLETTYLVYGLHFYSTHFFQRSFRDKVSVVMETSRLYQMFSNDSSKLHGDDHLLGILPCIMVKAGISHPNIATNDIKFTSLYH